METFLGDPGHITPMIIVGLWILHVGFVCFVSGYSGSSLDSGDDPLPILSIFIPPLFYLGAFCVMCYQWGKKMRDVNE